MLDEPSANLDGEAARRLLFQLQLLASDRNVTIVTHSPVFLAICNTVLVLDKGHIVAAGPGRQIVPRLFPKGGREAASEERAA